MAADRWGTRISAYLRGDRGSPAERLGDGDFPVGYVRDARRTGSANGALGSLPCGGLVFLVYAMRRVNCHRCGIVACRRSSLERRQTHTDQSLHALLSPLGAATVMERDGGGVSRLLGQGLRRGGAHRRLRAGAPGGQAKSMQSASMRSNMPKSPVIRSWRGR